MEVPNRYIAETWRELLNAEGVAVRLIVPPEHADGGDFAPRLLFVPDSKTHVAREILRKI